jgi:Amt family ammonium transporter
MASVDTGDTAWMLVSTSLALLTVLGVSLFYGGMARKKNVLATIMYGFTALCVVSVVWALWGYALAFGPDMGGMIGRLEWFGLTGVDAQPAEAAPTVPPALQTLFQGMLAAIAPTLISGALAERVKFSAFLLFTPLWVTFVYVPLVHWVWGGGWIGGYLSAIDFGGGLVVHVSAGVAGLAAAWMVGPRRGFGVDPLPPHDRVLTILGAGLLWFGWLGVAAGSAYSAGRLAAHVVLGTVLAAGTAALGWALLERSLKGKATVFGAATGSVAGLAAITAAAGFVDLWAAPIIGVGASLACYLAVELVPRLGMDDAFDVFALFGVGGISGVIATGFFASARVNPAGLNGALAGNPPLMGIQAIALSVVIGYVFVYTWIILKIVDWTIGLRVPEDDEIEGLDRTQHGERAYAL